MSDKISVIVPVYNSAKYLRKCIESITGQTYRDLEIILIDDGSADNSGAICDEYAAKDERIIVIHQKNMGASIARNKGLDICTGSYIGFVDGDDWIAPDMYEFLHGAILDHNADISICGYYIETEADGVCGAENDDGKTTVYSSREAIREVIQDKLIYSYFWDKLYRKEMFSELRFRKGIILEDIATMYKIFMCAGNIVTCNVPKYYYLQRNNSLLHVRDEALNWDQFWVYRERAEVLQENYPELRELSVVSLLKYSVSAYSYLLLQEELSEEQQEHKEVIKNTIFQYRQELKEFEGKYYELKMRMNLIFRKWYPALYKTLKRIVN